MATVSPDFGQAFDALDDEIAIIERKGVIVAANAAGRRFAADEGRVRIAWPLEDGPGGPGGRPVAEADVIG